jgi:EF hand
MFPSRRRFVTLVSGSMAAAGLAGGLPTLALGAADDGPPNVFFSPHGRPYRAPLGAPYPIVDWFRAADRNGDGKVDRDEFIADAAAFFDFLDLKGNGVLDTDEISFYEHRIAPEVLGMRVTVYADGRVRIGGSEAPRLWLAQWGQYGPSPGTAGPMEGGPLGHGDQQGGPNAQGGPGQPTLGGDPNEGQIISPDALPAPRKDLPQTGLGGASPFSLFRVPEPVTAADSDYVVNDVVRKANFLAHAHDNFAALDTQNAGYLTLAGLPQSPVEKLLGRSRRSS